MTDPTSSPQMIEVDAVAFREVFERELSYVWNTLQRLGVRREDVRDQAQEVFVVVHRLFPTFDSTRPVRPWLFGIAFRVASGYRDKQRRRISQDLDETLADEAPLPDEQVDQAGRRRLVLRALEHVDWSRRPVFVLAEIEGRTGPEIAEALDIPLNTAYSRLRLAREEFSTAVRRLSEQGATR